MRSYQLSTRLAERFEVDVVALRETGGSGDRNTERDSLPYASYEVIEIPTTNPPRFSPEWFALRVKSLRHPAAGYYRKHVAERLAALVAQRRPDVIVWGMSWMLPYARAFPRVPSAVDQQNYDPLITQRIARGKSGLEALKWRAYVQITVQAERRNLRYVQGISACSEEDAAIFRREAPHAEVAVVPNAVDAAFFAATGNRQPAAGVPTAIMTGSYSYRPNAEGARRLARHIWPLVLRAVPNAELRIVGLDGERVLGDIARYQGVTVVGTVDDVRPELARATVATAIIDAGGGTRLKILEAMAAGLPVVSTRIGAEGIAVTDGREVLLRDDDDAIATALISLLQHPQRAETMGRAGRELVMARYDWSTSADALERLLAGLA